MDGLSGLFSPDKAAQPTAKGRRVLRGAKLPEIQRELAGAISDLHAADAKTVLVLDQPDLLLAASAEELTGIALRNMLLDIQEVSMCSTITHIPPFGRDAAIVLVSESIG